MEVDDLRDDWRRAGGTASSANGAELLRIARQARIPGALRPIAHGQTAGLSIGLATALLGGAFLPLAWPQGWQSAAALTLISLGAATIAFAVQLSTSIATLDVTAPTLPLYRAITALRRRYVLGGLTIGLAWLFAWPLALAAAVGLSADADLIAEAPRFMALAVGSGIALHAVALTVCWRIASGPLGAARIERWFSARELDESLALLGPFE